MKRKKNKFRAAPAIPLILAAILTACGSDAAFRVGGDAVTKEEYRYHLYAQLAQIAPYQAPDSYEAYLDADAGGRSEAERIKEEAVKAAAKLRAAEAKYKETGRDFEAESAEAYKQSILRASAPYGGEEECKAYLEANNLSYEAFEREQKAAVMSEVLKEEYFKEGGEIGPVAEEKIKARYAEDYVRAKHIWISVLDAKGQFLSEEERARKDALIVEVYGYLTAGEDFEDLLARYGEDRSMDLHPDGYVFTRGEMNAIFEETAFALEAGEVSGIVRGRYGYHIIKRYPLGEGETYIEAHEAIKDRIMSEEMRRLTEEWAEETEITKLSESASEDEALSPYAILKQILDARSAAAAESESEAAQGP
jgi:parvulin-like peptidyl-prolyl isomerase